ncbi:hypothetical protein E2C01_006659 [Portunus trituberculatus]|uniref:Uncharacterized protein n=1 Tax=Portunus trituberculatus TaxID=210409 RepID=A0A5B7CWY1_PORTR|nr:hypothetical protein [Portunus trituberculatus]
MPEFKSLCFSRRVFLEPDFQGSRPPSYLLKGHDGADQLRRSDGLFFCWHLVTWQIFENVSIVQPALALQPLWSVGSTRRGCVLVSPIYSRCIPLFSKHFCVCEGCNTAYTLVILNWPFGCSPLFDSSSSFVAMSAQFTADVEQKLE